jgi:hypothetical protein
MILTISYEGSDNTDYYQHLQNRLIKNCEFYSLPHKAYHQNWLRTTQFYQDHKDLLNEKRGAGFWSWKPFIIADALSSLKEGDILCYLDASTTMKVDPTPVIESVKDVLVCDSSWVNHDWIKRDCFILMDCDRELYWNATQCWAGAVIVRNTELGNRFIADWGHYCCDRRIISDDPSVLGQEMSYFRDHRHDQGILTLLITKYMQEFSIPGIETQPTLPFVDE